MNKSPEFFQRLGSYLCGCGQKPTFHGMCDECWENHGLKKFMKKLKEVKEDVKLKKDFYYTKLRCR